MAPKMEIRNSKGSFPVISANRQGHLQQFPQILPIGFKRDVPASLFFYVRILYTNTFSCIKKTRMTLAKSYGSPMRVTWCNTQ